MRTKSRVRVSIVTLNNIVHCYDNGNQFCILLLLRIIIARNINNVIIMGPISFRPQWPLYITFLHIHFAIWIMNIFT